MPRGVGGIVLLFGIASLIRHVNLRSLSVGLLRLSLSVRLTPESARPAFQLRATMSRPPKAAIVSSTSLLTTDVSVMSPGKATTCGQPRR